MICSSGVWTRWTRGLKHHIPPRRLTAKDEGSWRQPSRTASSPAPGAGMASVFLEGQVSTPGTGLHSPGLSTGSVIYKAHRRPFQEELWFGCSEICSWLSFNPAWLWAKSLRIFYLEFPHLLTGTKPSHKGLKKREWWHHKGYCIAVACRPCCYNGVGLLVSFLPLLYFEF